ncbi:hypothetical protein ED733_003054 [Metarhizium rileyi]|uniref:Uncharacterized protein n=1 Tax=Metarhizium rileyi (strain RCEF 4871) TaxID=1649241 RepID=A0A5C6GA38_METRR|nr:hypothetical protein ED733_003054 [Metarhizium rileyi]
MAFTARKPSTGNADLPNQLLRQALMSLTINPRVSKHRISKPAQRTQRTQQSRCKVSRKIYRQESLQLCPAQRDRAVAIFNKLAGIKCVANRTPSLCGAINGEIKLKYPPYRFWRLLEDSFMPPLIRTDIQSLRETVIQYIKLLYDAQIPYAPDVTTLEVVTKIAGDSLARPIYRPFINQFYFDVDLRDEAFPWADRGATTIRNVKAQFVVLELLAELSNPDPFEVQRLSLGLEASVVRHVNTYSTELGQFVLDLTGQYLRSLSFRNGPCERSDSAHALPAGNVPSETEILRSHRVALLVLHAALLVHCYAETITVIASYGLLEASKRNTMESYTTNEDFTLVTQACQTAGREIRELAEKGTQLDQDIMYFVRTDSSLFPKHNDCRISPEST